MTTRPVTVVTGGSRGIGAATCRRLAADGHDVVLGYCSAAHAARDTAEAVRDRGGRCAVAELDTADPAGVDRLFDTAAELGRVTGLVNNAGVTGPVGRLVDVPVDQLLRVFEVDVVGCALCARRAPQETTSTDIHADPERPAKVASTIPMGRSGQPEEIAAAFAWLPSGDASYASGAILRVAGGR